VKYSDGFKARMVRRLTGPAPISATKLAEEIGVCQSTLSRWLLEACREVKRGSGVERTTHATASRPVLADDFPAAEKLRLVREAAELSDEELGAFLRRHGLHQGPVGREESVGGDDVEARRGVDDDEIWLGCEVFQGLGEGRRTVRRKGYRKAAVGGDEREVGDLRRDDGGGDVGDWSPTRTGQAREDLTERQLAGLAGADPEADAGVGLRIEVHQEDLLSEVTRQRSRQVDGGRGLPHPALLVGDGYGDSRHLFALLSWFQNYSRAGVVPEAVRMVASG
jgi:transposase-like protein